MPNSDHRAKATIEDLLHLKRAEQPDAAFWSNFDRELRQKQLTALLEKRPWWQTVPQLLARRAYLPIGATAILAFTLVSIKYYAPVQVVQADRIPVGTNATPSHFDAAPSHQMASAPVSSPLVNRNDPASKELTADTVTLATSQPATTDEMSPSARSIAANLAHLEQSEPELVNSVMGNHLSSPARVRETPSPAMELASLSSSSGSTRSRLLAHYNDRQASSPEPVTTDAVRERIARRLADTDYTERFSRIGLKGDQVSLKF